MKKPTQVKVRGEVVENEYNWFQFHMVISSGNKPEQILPDPRSRRFMKKEDAIKAMKAHVDDYVRNLTHQLRSNPRRKKSQI